MIEVIREAGKAVIRPTGENVVASTAPAIRSQMRAAMAEGVREIVVDLGSVRTVDSAGIGLLIAAHNSLHKAGGRLTVVHANKDVLDLFRLMRIHQHFSVSGE